MRREIRFRSPSSNRNNEDDMSGSGQAHNLRREQTEPSMRYKNRINAEQENSASKTTFPVPEKVLSRASEDNVKTSKDEIPVRKLSTFSTSSLFTRDNDKENSVPQTQTPPPSQPRTNSYVGSRKPPKPKVASSLNPRYLQATESSSRYLVPPVDLKPV